MWHEVGAIDNKTPEEVMNVSEVVLAMRSLLFKETNVSRITSRNVSREAVCCCRRPYESTVSSAFKDKRVGHNSKNNDDDNGPNGDNDDKRKLGLSRRKVTTAAECASSGAQQTSRKRKRFRDEECAHAVTSGDCFAAVQRPKNVFKTSSRARKRTRIV